MLLRLLAQAPWEHPGANQLQARLRGKREEAEAKWTSGTKGADKSQVGFLRRGGLKVVSFQEHISESTNNNIVADNQSS